MNARARRSLIQEAPNKRGGALYFDNVAMGCPLVFKKLTLFAVTLRS
jgi:hypothetical protein